MNDSTRLVPNHSHWGAFLAEVENGRFVGVRPFPRDPDPSPLIEAMPAAVHSPMRVAAPMVREGYLARGPGHGEGRGREPFVPVSWERALDLVAGELERVRRDHGHAAIMGGSQGWGSAGIFHDARTQVRRFLSAFGGDGSAFPWAISLAATGEFVGGIELRMNPPKADFGYILCRNHWGRGLATESASHVVRWALAQPQIFRVWATCHPANLASARVLEKSGLTYEGRLARWEPRPNLGEDAGDSLVYAATRARVD